MGGSGIWAMHFIANRAIVLNNGDPDHQISYSPGFTALSFFLPIIVLLMAFHFLASTGNAKSLYLVLGGVLTGTAVCGMHYLGDAGIANYHCVYHVPNVVGAAIIAVAASLIALSVFFRLRETWTDVWWKRTLCGLLLASAVAGMHWTAVVGTTYQFKGTTTSTRDATRIQTVIVCAVLVSCPYLKRKRLT
jgi:NO-binding membrane sensor protein with MHYT domain